MFNDGTSRRTFLKNTTALITLTGLARPAKGAGLSPSLGIAEWQRNMIKHGRQHGRTLAAWGPNDPLDPPLSATYYDAQRVYFQIADYTKDDSWLAYATAARSIYRDRYVIANKGKIPGYWLFTQGIAMHYQRTRDPVSRDAVKMLSESAAYAADTTETKVTASPLLSREASYAISAKLDAESVGESRSPRLARLVDQALGHIDQWFVSKNAPYIQPFMVGLTAEALIRWDDKMNDSRVLPALKLSAAYLWNRLWVAPDQAFKYLDRETPGEGGPTPAPDLNLLIAPLYAWIYHKNGDTAYRDRAVAIFVGGVKKAFLTSPKQFNQNYRLSFDYLKWVTEKPKA